MFNKLLKNTGMTRIVYCPHCKNILENTNNENCYCDVCKKRFLYSNLCRDGNCFFHIPIELQLRQVLEGHNLGHHINKNLTTGDGNTFSDISDGFMYKSTMTNSNTYCMSLTINTDGVPVFRSSKYSIWPIFAYINELPANIRKKHMILCGLWAGPMKPIIDLFFVPLQKEPMKLAQVGFKWVRLNRCITSNVYVIAFNCDAVARCMLQNIKQFNGRFGCTWCLHPGIRLGHVNTYPGSEACEPRTQTNYLQHLAAAAIGDESFGVKGSTIISSFPRFHIIKSFVVDSMHCVDLGIMRQLSNLWFDSNHHGQDWYIGMKLDDIDILLLQFRVPSNLSRSPRSLKCRVHWKASEWRSFLLFFGPIILIDILPVEFYNHFVLLTKAIFLMLKETISQRDLFDASQYLKTFVADFENLYGAQHCTYNMHQLLHVTDCVRNFGPLWGYSAYSFENFNGILQHYFHGTQAVGLQVVNSYLHIKSIQIKGLKHFNNAPDVVHRFYEQMISRHVLLKHVYFSNGTTLMGIGKSKMLGHSEKDAVALLVEIETDDQQVTVYEKAIHNSIKYMTCLYTRQQKRNDTIVEVHGLNYQLECFLTICDEDGNEHVVCLGSKIVTREELGFEHIRFVDYIGEMDAFWPADLQKKKVAYSSINNELIAICALPNTMEVD